MCKLNKKLRKKTFTGYKYAVKKNGKYYSPCTGVEYVIEDIAAPVYEKIINDRIDYLFVHPTHILLPGGQFFSDTMIGYTGVFITEEGARGLCEDGQVNGYEKVILKITISDTLKEGILESQRGNYKIIAGKRIDKMEEIL